MKVYRRRMSLREVSAIMFVCFAAGYLAAAVVAAKWWLP